MKYSVFFLFFVLSCLLTRTSYGLPAFALREKVSCVVCHTNGSAPHLTKVGYLYRRAGFRFPTYIGNVEKDNESLQILHHLAVGVNVDYELVTNKPPSGGAEGIVNNNFDVREAEIWPLVGGFFGNYGVWSELDMTPNTAADRTSATPPNSTTAPNGGVNFNQADLRYVWGNPDFFFNMRAGMLAPEGFGASDQWVDDGNLPLFDKLTAFYNQDTLAAPLGAMGNPQMGAEFGINNVSAGSHLTLGVYNGFDGTNGFANQIQSTATPALTNQEAKGTKDYKVQLDQFLGDQFEVTGVYYNGHVNLLDPTNTVVWTNAYQLYRGYVTYMAVPSVFDVLAGGALGQYDYVDPGNNTAAGQFQNRGAFVGANYYVMPHLTLSGRLDYFQYAYGVDSSPRAQGYSLMASLPHENSIFVFHFMQTADELEGLSNDFRIEWRFLF